MAVLLRKSAVGNLPAGREIASAVMGIFRQQYERYLASPSDSMGRWDAKLADALQKPLLQLYMRSAIKARGNRPLDERELAADLTANAKTRALELARDLNSTSRQWLEQGREGATIFSADRAASIGLTEASRAHHDAKAVTASAAGVKRLRWVAKGSSCPECKSLNGKTIEIGKEFVSKGGTRAEYPPLHPH